MYVSSSGCLARADTNQAVWPQMARGLTFEIMDCITSNYDENKGADQIIVNTIVFPFAKIVNQAVNNKKLFRFA